MNRRSLLRYGGRAAALAPFWAAAPALAGLSRLNAAAQTVPPGVLRRIGITTVCFRDRFVATRDKKAGPVPAGEELTLLTAPKFVADTLGLHNVEIWSAQFADMSLDYCKQIKAAAAAAGSRITNIQVDGPENLSDPDAAKRAASVETIKRWMDRAAAVGAPTCRANTGGGPPEAWDVNRTADSFRQLARIRQDDRREDPGREPHRLQRGHRQGRRVIKAVNDPNCRAICDWGNTPSTRPTGSPA